MPNTLPTFGFLTQLLDINFPTGGILVITLAPFPATGNAAWPFGPVGPVWAIPDAGRLLLLNSAPPLVPAGPPLIFANQLNSVTGEWSTGAGFPPDWLTNASGFNPRFPIPVYGAFAIGSYWQGPTAFLPAPFAYLTQPQYLAINLKAALALQEANSGPAASKILVLTFQADIGPPDASKAPFTAQFTTWRGTPNLDAIASSQLITGSANVAPADVSGGVFNTAPNIWNFGIEVDMSSLKLKVTSALA